MNYSELIKKINSLFELIEQRKIRDSFDILRTLVESCKNKDLKNQLENHFSTYENMLKYSFEMGNDPEKEKVYKRLIKSIIELSDDIKEDIILNNKLLSHYQQKKETEWYSRLTEEETVDLIDSLAFENKLKGFIGNTASIEDDGNESKDDGLAVIFKLIWMADKFSANQIKLVRKILEPEALPWYDKCVVVSALTLSLLRHFDQNKVELLFEFYELGEHQICQRALIGLVLALYHYDSRLYFYPDIIQRLKSMQGNKKITGEIEAVIIQIIKAKDTEKVTKKIREELLPEVMKLKSKLEDKLDLENILSEESLDGENPEWEEMFKDSPDMYDKFEEFSKLQMEGSDVFLGAFSMLKHFDFFDEIKSWFLPFYKENEFVQDVMENVSKDFDTGSFTEGLEKTFFLCNSDKYSFCLNVKHMPDQQKKMMLELFNMELKAMNEIADSDDLIDSKTKERSVITQYIQDLYRFFKLFSLKNEFTDVFKQRLDIHNTSFFAAMIDDPGVVRNIGEFYFQKGHFKEAIDIFEQLSDSLEDYELFEKIGYSYQLLGDFENALVYYQKAELLEHDKLWLFKKIAYCSRKLGLYDKTIEYYQMIEKKEPENLYVQIQLGHTNLDKGDFEGALKYYFKVEYLAPENYKVRRPIAWCAFVDGKFDVAKKYLKKVMTKEANENDYMNLGHVEWCLGSIKNAVKNYKQCIKEAEGGFKWFEETFKEDSDYLIKHGIASLDLPLMFDYLKMFA